MFGTRGNRENTGKIPEKYQKNKAESKIKPDSAQTALIEE
jgi:hypothetical protein